MELEMPVLAALIAAAIALFGILANHRLSVYRENAATVRTFATILQEAIAVLDEPRNTKKDAFAILEERFPVQYGAYLNAVGAAGLLRRACLRRAWREYYGQEAAEETEWWLPNEYSSILSNQLGNDPDSTRRLATSRLDKIIRACR